MSELKRSIQQNGGKLALFALVSTGLVVAVNLLTAERINAQAQQQLFSTLSQVLPAQTYDEGLAQDCISVTDEALGNLNPKRVYRAKQQGQTKVLIIESTAPDGYSGNIELLIGVDSAGTVTGVRTLAHKETPGLGDKIDIKRHPWITTFAGKTALADQDARWAVKKDGGQFDQFTGATITPRAVVAATYRTVNFAKRQFATLASANAQCPEPK